MGRRKDPQASEESVAGDLGEEPGFNIFHTLGLRPERAGIADQDEDGKEEGSSLRSGWGSW